MAAIVKLIAGPVRSGKTTRLLAIYRDFLQSGQRGSCQEKAELAGRALWIGPGSQAISQVRDRLFESSDQAFLNPQIHTFAGFADATIANSDRRILPISRLQKRRILQQVAGVALETGQLGHFSRVAQAPGFLAQVDELIAELKRQDVWPDGFVKLCRQPRDHDLAVIYGLYQQYLNDHDLYDAEGRFWEARRYLSESSAADKVDTRLVVVEGFSDFTSAQYDILELLSRRADQTLFSLTLERSCLEKSSKQFAGRSLLFAKTKKTLERLKQKFPDLEVEFVDETYFSVPAIHHLERNLFRDPNDLRNTAPTTAGIEIVAANGMHGEIEELARRIKRLLHGGEVRPAEVVVAFRHLGDIAARIHEVFTDHGIPHAMGPWQTLGGAPLFRGIVSLLRLHADDWPFGQLLAVVGNRLFRLFDDREEGHEGYSQTARIAIERCLRAAQLPAGSRELLAQLQHWASSVGETASDECDDEGKSSGDKKLAQLASEASLAFGKLTELAGLLESLPLQAPLTEWISHLERLTDRLGMFPAESGGSDPQLAKTVRAWNILRRGLGAIEKIDGGPASDSAELSIREFVELLESIGSELQLPAEHDEVGRVRILSAEVARYVSVRHFFLAGLSEQSFSAADSMSTSSMSTSLASLLQTDDRGSLAHQPDLSEDRLTLSSSAGDEMLLFYELATRATEQLTLSYPALDAKGQALSPSPLLIELEQCFGESQLLKTLLPLGVSAAANAELQQTWSNSAHRQQAVARALAGDPHWLAGMVAKPESARLGNSLLSSIRCVAGRGKRGVFGPFEGILEGDRAQAVLAKRFDSAHIWSASQLESYATCPFRFFVEQILSLEPTGELTLQSDVRRRGSLLHQVLATLHQHLSSADEAFEESSELVERFHAVLREVIAATPLGGLQQWLREIERREIEAWAEQYAEQETAYREKWGHLDQPLRPALFEVRFGPQVRFGNKASVDQDSTDKDSTVLPFELDLGAEQILLTGQIDRVDLGRVGKTTVFNIIDYKSGAEVKLEDKKIRSGRQLQLPLYALAAERLLLADQGAVALSTGYWSIQGKGFASGRRGSSLEIRELKGQSIQTSEQWEQLQPLIMRRIGQLVGGIRGGQFPVINEDENCTRACSFNTICRVAHTRSLEKEWEIDEINDEARMTKHE